MDPHHHRHSETEQTLPRSVEEFIGKDIKTLSLPAWRLVWQEWVCATDPTNTALLLKILSPTGGALGRDVPWLSVTNRNYFLQRTTNLALQASFLAVATNVPGQVGITTFTDTNAAGGGPFFYRVGVRYP
jgi:hypothetical protein